MTVKSNPQQYPRWITLPDGSKTIVHNHQHHSALSGIEHDENAQPVQKHEPESVEKHQPPSLEQVLAAGYNQEGAEKIVAQERIRFEQGLYPYGESTKAPEPTPQPEPQHEDEEDLSAMFKKKE